MNSELNSGASSPPVPPSLEPEIVEIPLPELLPELDPDLDLEVPLDAGIPLEIDPESIVEAAEQLLREGAPHDFDVLVIGGGPGGMAAAIKTAKGGLHTGLIEKRALGGNYLHEGCIASKMLLAGVQAPREPKTLSPNLAELQAKKAKLVTQLQQKMHQELEESGVEILTGRARFLEQHTLEIEQEGQTRRLNAVHIVIAVGGVPERVAVEGADLPNVVTYEELLRQDGAPPRLAIIGAGTVAVELASLFHGLGSKVSILPASDAILPGEDDEIQAELQRCFQDEGIEIHTKVAIARIEKIESSLRVVYQQNGIEMRVEADQVLLATGRVPDLRDLELNRAGFETVNDKIEVERDFQTGTSGVYAIGDCIRRDGWFHQAVREGKEVADIILGLLPDTSSHFLPRCCYCDPQVASVGLNLREALDLGIKAKGKRSFFADNIRACLGGAVEAALKAKRGWVNLIFDEDSERILGCQIIGQQASELIGEAALAIRLDGTLTDLNGLWRGHPTFGETLA